MASGKNKNKESATEDSGGSQSSTLHPLVINPLSEKTTSLKPYSVADFEADQTKKSLSWFELQYCLPDPNKRENPFWLYALAFGVSVFSSFYYKDFTRNFTKRSLTALGSPYASEIADLCGVCSFSVNLFIGIRNLMDAYYKITTELPDKYKNANTGHVSDTAIRAFVILTIFAALIGVAPNLVFTYDTLMNRKSPLPFVVFNIIIQTIAVGTMNLRGITNNVDIDRQRKKAAQKTRKKILIALNNTLDPSKRLTEQQLNYLSKGEIYDLKYPRLRQAMDAMIRVFPVFYCLGFFTSAVMFFAPVLVGTGIAIQLLMTLNIFVGLISFALRLLFLAAANVALIKKIMGYIEKPIIDAPSLNDQFVLPKALLITSLIISLIISALSLGGPAAVIFNYITDNIGVSYAGGFLAAYGINTSDSFALICDIVAYVYFRFKAFIEGRPFDVKAMPWVNGDDYVKSRMLRVAEMKDAEVVKEFTTKICAGANDNAAEEAEHGNLYEHGIKYLPNAKMQKMLETCDNLKYAGANEFTFFKKHYHDREAAIQTLGVSEPVAVAAAAV